MPKSKRSVLVACCLCLFTAVALAFSPTENDPLLDAAERAIEDPAPLQSEDLSNLLLRKSSYWAPSGARGAIGILLAKDQEVGLWLICPFPSPNPSILVRDFGDGKTEPVTDISTTFKEKLQSTCQSLEHQKYRQTSKE
jgi:hypothetical protein